VNEDTGSPGWLFNELAHAGPEHLDAGYVAAYDTKAGTDPAEDLTVLLDMGLDENRVLVDLGAGTGTFALAAAPHCRQVIAVDVSVPMLTALQVRAQQEGIGNITVVQAGFLTYEHQGEPADFVYSRNALHHLPDFWKAVAVQRVAAMLKPRGILRLRDLIFSFGLGETEERIETWLAGASTQPGVGWTRAELEEHLRQEYSTFSWLMEPMLEQAGFEIRSAEYGSSGIYAAYTCVRS
jgi:ubiquinone/menaquinone biosynthesis C-methylase UbiE